MQGASVRGRPWRFGESAAPDAPQATISSDGDVRRAVEIKVVSPRHLPIGAVLECLPCTFLGLRLRGLTSVVGGGCCAFGHFGHHLGFRWAAAAAASCLASRAASTFLILFFIDPDLEFFLLRLVGCPAISEASASPTSSSEHAGSSVGISRNVQK